MHRTVSGLAMATLVGALVVVPQADAGAGSAGSHESAHASRAVPSTWQEGVRAGTTRFSSVPGARCHPITQTGPEQRRCLLTFSGRFTATDKGWHGRYEGRVIVTYLAPDPDDYAAFEAGNVTYRVYDEGGWLGRLDLEIDSGTGGINGFPRDLRVDYSYNERNEQFGSLWVCGSGYNHLNAALEPVRTYVDRLAYFDGGPC